MNYYSLSLVTIGCASSARDIIPQYHSIHQIKFRRIRRGK
jgi:hypothetical protein